jgi:hypothetical protein
MTKCKVIKPLTPMSLKQEIDIGTTKRYVSNYYTKLKHSAGLLGGGQQEFLKLREALDTSLHGLINNTVQRVGKADFAASWMSAVIGWRKSGLSENFSLGGSINERLLRGTNAAYNVFSMWVQSHAQPVVIRHHEYLRSLLPNASTKELEILIHDSAVVGSTGELMELLASSYGGKRFLDKRLTSFMENLDAIGLTEAQALQVIENGKEYAELYKTGQAYLLDNGVDMARFAGYVPLLFDKRISEAVGKRFKTFQQLIDNTFVNVGNDILGTSAKSDPRLTYVDYVINDIEITKARLGGAFPGVNTDDIMRWADDPDVFKLEVLDKLKPGEIEELLKDGTLSRVPSMHSTIVELLVRKEGLPAGVAEEVLLTDPKLALKQWTQSLERITKESFAIKDMLTNGVTNGWVVDAAIANAHPEQFIELSTLPLLTKFFPATLSTAIGQQYVHQIVARQLNAVLELNSNPIAASVLGDYLDTFGKFAGYLQKSLLSNPVSVITQLTQNAIQTVSAVGAPVYLPKAMNDVFKVLSGGIESLGTERYIKFGAEEISEQELMLRLLATRGSTDLGSLQGIKSLSREHLKSIFQYDYRAGIERAKLNLRYMPLKTIAGLPIEAVNKAFAPVAFSNFIGDVSSRYAIVLTLNNPAMAGANKFLSRAGSQDSVEAALQYADEYIGLFDSKSEFLGVASRYIRPFASYVMNAPGQTLRHAMRHPRRFANTMKFYHHYAITEDRESAGYDKKSWQRGKLLIPLWHNKETGEKVMMAPGSVSSNIALLDQVDALFNASTRLTGGNTRDKIADLEARVNPAKAQGDFLGSIIEGNYFQTISDAITGRNPFTGASPTAEQGFTKATLFNVEMTPQLRSLVLLALPAANQIDRALPANISGKREKRSADGTTVLEPGVPGIFGNTPESGGVQGTTPINAGLGVLGLRPVYADTVANIVTNYSDIEGIIKDGQRVQRTLIQRGRGDTQEFAAVTEAIRRAELLKVDINRYAIDNNVQPPEAVRAIKQQYNKPTNDYLKMVNERPY